MHKLAKGLKKKKKGKKSKHKEEELFKPEELEAYRREHAGTNEESSGKNEEWKNFLSLTSGVDDILKKTQDDLDRIKSTSFFQRIPPPSEAKAKKEQAPPTHSEYHHAPKEEAASAPKEEDPTLGIVEVSESESEEEEDDDIFDTAYIDAIATGEVKLAYIPESPTDKPDGDDPFDTSIAERVILGPAVERKGKKLVPLGAAVEVLTGRVQLPTCATIRPVSSKRQILKQRDLLLGSFDNDTEPSADATYTVSNSSAPIRTLLDDDHIPLPDEPIDLSKNLYIPPPQPVESQSNRVKSTQQDILKEFEDDEDKEFEALAAESLAKTTSSAATAKVLSGTVVSVVGETGDWKPFEKEESFDADFEKDPFDTTFAENILPGKAELKLLERDILDNDLDFDPRAPERKNSIIYNDRVPESELKLIAPVHRDLLGGSTSDLSKLGEKPIQPTEEPPLEQIKYCDPFDTSIVDAVKAPGQAELKLLENELLGAINPSEPVAPAKVLKSISIDDDSFNPRALEAQRSKTRALSRPDVLNVGQSKTVSFTVPQKDLLGAEDTSKIIKPLTPFYVRKNSVPGADIPEDQSSDEVDPFDTSFVPSVAPGKAELKQIESELFCDNNKKPVSLDDPDFDPRDERKIAKISAVEAIKEIANPKLAVSSSLQKEPIDLLSASNDISAKVLTPAGEITSSVVEDKLFYADPFDTSIASNIPPGKAELRLLESELIQSNLAEVSFLDRNKDLLVHSGDTIIEKPLSPQLGNSFDIEPEDFDPFDTSFASNIQPGRAELKVLESELI